MTNVPSRPALKTLLVWMVGIPAVVVLTAALWWMQQDLEADESPLLPPGAALPELTADGWINGDVPAWSALAGKVVVLEVWGPGCSICWRIAPEMVELSEKYGPRGVAFVGLTPYGDERLDDIAEFVSKNELPWPNGYGAAQTTHALGVRRFPTLFIIGADGRVAWNSHQREPFLNALERVLKKSRVES